MDSNTNKVFANFLPKKVQTVQTLIVANPTKFEYKEISNARDTVELSNKKNDKNKILTLSLIGTAILSIVGTAFWFISNRNKTEKTTPQSREVPLNKGVEAEPSTPKVTPKPEVEIDKTSLEIELEDINKITDENEKIAKLTEYNKKVEGIIKMNEVSDLNKSWSDLANLKGFGRLAGYADEKKILLDKVCVPIANEKYGKRANVPACILLYGPQGTGKTIFAKVLAGQTDCELVDDIEHEDTREQTLKKIKEEAIKAQERFKQEGKRTIIHLDELDILADDPRIAGHLKEFMDTSSEKYHCTLFGTTNYPDRLNDIFLGHEKLLKISVPPAHKENAVAILRYFTEIAGTDGRIEYEEIAEQIVKHQPDRAFSNSRIEKIIKSLAMSLTTLGKQIGHSDLLEAFKNSDPDITKEIMESFAKNIKRLR